MLFFALLPVRLVVFVHLLLYECMAAWTPCGALAVHYNARGYKDTLH